jgi:hypothetical protein
MLVLRLSGLSAAAGLALALLMRTPEVGPPLIGILASLFGLPAALSLVVVFGVIIANSVHRAVADPASP